MHMKIKRERWEARWNPSDERPNFSEGHTRSREHFAAGLEHGSHHHFVPYKSSLRVFGNSNNSWTLHRSISAQFTIYITYSYNYFLYFLLWILWFLNEFFSLLSGFLNDELFFSHVQRRPTGQCSKLSCRMGNIQVGTVEAVQWEAKEGQMTQGIAAFGRSPIHGTSCEPTAPQMRSPRDSCCSHCFPASSAAGAFAAGGKDRYYSETSLDASTTLECGTLAAMGKQTDCEETQRQCYSNAPKCSKMLQILLQMFPQKTSAHGSPGRLGPGTAQC